MRSMSLKLLTIFLGLSGFTATAAAQDISMLPEGQALIVLSATESVSVEPDVLQAQFRVEQRSEDPAQLQSEINAQMTKALQLLEGKNALEVSTGRYSVYRVNGGGQLRSKELWHGTQSLNIKSSDDETVLALSAQLQEMGLLVSQLNYVLSDEKAATVRDSLLEAAIEKARSTAERTGRALGKAEVDIASVSIDESFAMARPMMARAEAMSDASGFAPPVAQDSKAEVSLTVRVQAIAQ